MRDGRFGRRTFLRSMAAGGAGLALTAHTVGRVRAASPAPAAPTGALAALARDLPGRILLPGDPAWTELTYQSNSRWLTPPPMALALPESAEEVATCVRWARDAGVPFATRSGGHNYAGHSASPGLVISTIRMKKALLDQATGTLIAGAGVQNADLAIAQRAEGTGRWILPGGTCPSVAITGLTLGGGIGPNGRWAGLTADHLRSTTLVTADGEIVTASADENADLFWALRGIGGGQLGIHTEHVYALAEVPAASSHVLEVLSVGPEAVAAQANALIALLRDGPRTVSALFSSYSDPVDGVVSQLWAQIIEPAEREEEIVRQLVAPGSEITGRGELPWWEAQSWLLGSIDPPKPYWDRSRYAPADLDPAVVEDLVRRLAAFPSESDGTYGELVLYGWLGGAVADVARDATAYVHRDAPLLLRISSIWEEEAPLGPDGHPGIPDLVRSWIEPTWEAALPHLLPESYQNFPDPELADWEPAYYAENLPRLRAVKAAWDPEDLFRHDQSIAPA